MRRYLITSACAIALFAVELFTWDGDSTTRGDLDIPAVLLVVVSAAGMLAAVAAWRWPVPAGIIVALTALIAIIVPAWQPFGSVLIALYVLARTLPVTGSRIALAVALGLLGINAWNSAGWQEEVSFATFVPIAAIWSLVAFGTWWAGRAGYRSAGQVRELEETLVRAEEEVRTHERRVLARELHDIVAHSVTAMVLRAAGARAAAGEDSALRQAFTDIEESGAQAVRELHRLLHTMHGTVATHASDDGRPGLAQVEALLNRTRAAGFTVTLTETGSRQALDASVDLTAYRCIQEALANAMHHGGPGTTMAVTLEWDFELRITVRSSGGRGAGSPPRPSGGFGLVGLSERLASVGGGLTATPVGDAFQLVARIPTRENSAERTP